MLPKDFIAVIAPVAQQSQLITKIPASFVIADAALESGWGNDAPGMNLFGVKANSSWHGEIIMESTREFIHGLWVRVNAPFRSYSDWLGSISDHADFLLANPRYKGAFAYNDGINFANAVAASGYATDPQYAQKLANIINTHNLQQYDTKTT